MEGAQDAQAVLGSAKSRFYLDLVVPTTAASKVGYFTVAGGMLAAIALLLLQLPGLALTAALLSIAFAGFKWPAAKAAPMGRLLFFSDKLIVQTEAQQAIIPLSSATTAILTYQGYANERLGAKAYASGHTNFMQFNNGPKYAFVVANEATQHTLTNELKNWYLRKVNLREYRWGNRTILLLATPTYEQLQQLKQELGVSLYT